jgi:hypothetical protein
MGCDVLLWDCKRTEPPGKARNAGAGEPRVQQPLDPLADEVGFSRALVACDLGKFDHLVIVEGDGDGSHGPIMTVDRASVRNGTPEPGST